MPRSPRTEKGSKGMSDRRTDKDFIYGKLIGEGSFSSVYLAKDIHTDQEYAVKVCDKEHIKRERKVQQTIRERDIMNLLNDKWDDSAPYFVKLSYAFQDESKLYFVMTFCKNGELLSLLQRVGNFDREGARFYFAEMVRAMEHLHALNIIHRDMKPENILLDEGMHIKITDFGCAKILTKEEVEAAGCDDRPRKNSFVGTAQYVPPELLSSKGCGPGGDMWALGCILYQMVSGLPPFRSKSEYFIYQKIQKLEYEFPNGFCEDAKDMVRKLLVIDPADRLGASDPIGRYTSLRGHPLLAGLDLDTMHLTTPPKIAPFLPQGDEEVGGRGAHTGSGHTGHRGQGGQEMGYRGQGMGFRGQEMGFRGQEMGFRGQIGQILGQGGQEMSFRDQGGQILGQGGQEGQILGQGGQILGQGGQEMGFRGQGGQKIGQGGQEMGFRGQEGQKIGQGGQEMGFRGQGGQIIGQEGQEMDFRGQEMGFRGQGGQILGQGGQEMGYLGQGGQIWGHEGHRGQIGQQAGGHLGQGGQEMGYSGHRGQIGQDSGHRGQYGGWGEMGRERGGQDMGHRGQIDIEMGQGGQEIGHTGQNLGNEERGHEIFQGGQNLVSEGQGGQEIGQGGHKIGHREERGHEIGQGGHEIGQGGHREEGDNFISGGGDGGGGGDEYCGCSYGDACQCSCGGDDGGDGCTCRCCGLSCCLFTCIGVVVVLILLRVVVVVANIFV